MRTIKGLGKFGPPCSCADVRNGSFFSPIFPHFFPFIDFFPPYYPRPPASLLPLPEVYPDSLPACRKKYKPIPAKNQRRELKVYISCEACFALIAPIFNYFFVTRIANLCVSILSFTSSCVYVFVKEAYEAFLPGVVEGEMNTAVKKLNQCIT